MGRSRGVVGRREFGDRAVLWKELDCLRNAFGMRGWDIDTIASVVLACWDDVPAINAVWGPRSSLVRGLKDKDLGPWVSKGGGVEIKGPI